MQAIVKFLRYLSLWYSQFVVGESRLSIISFWIGLTSFVTGIAATIYSYQAARGSDRLLRRLVIYPFRELDLAISNLTPVQRDELIQLYRMSHGKRSFTVGDATKVIGQFAEASLEVLAEEGWLRKEGKDETRFRVNPDRRAYLVFSIEAEQND